jgi:molybdate transport system substrate-binding protein
MRRLVAPLLIPLALALALPAAAGTGADRLTVLGAASLADVLPKIDRAPRYTFAGSDQLAAQISLGAPADVFLAASPAAPQALYREGLVYRPVGFATNRLVLVVPRANRARIRTVFDLRRSGIKLVVGRGGVPIGAYTRAALRKLGLSRVLRNVVSEETDVRSILAKVALDEADAGFVYATDVRAGAGRVRGIALPRRAQPTIRYELAIVRATKSLSVARAFVRRVLGPAGRGALKQAGFALP